MLILRWFLNALALVLVSQLVPGFEVTSFYGALIAALVLGLLNATVRPLLFLLTLPINIVSLGAFSLVLNAIIILLVSSIVKNFEVHGFAPAFWGALILWVVSWATSYLTQDSSPATANVR